MSVVRTVGRPRRRREIEAPPPESIVDVVGNVYIEIADADGNPLHEETVHNKVTATGRDLLRDMLFGVAGGPGWLAIGKASTAVSDTDVALGNEYYRAQVTRRISSTGKATYKLHLTTAEANLSEAELDDNQRIREIALFVGSSYTTAGVPLRGGRLFARALVTPIAKTVSIQVTITWEFPISSS